VVSETSIAELHEILQSAFGGSGEHLRRFLIRGAAYGIPHLGNRERCPTGAVPRLLADAPGQPSFEALARPWLYSRRRERPRRQKV
jgi:hypothetical protein